MSDRATSPEPVLDAEPPSVLELSLARYDRALHSGDEVALARARLTLCQELRDSGWEAPPVVVGQMLRDHAMLEPTTIDLEGITELTDLTPLAGRAGRAVSPALERSSH